MNAHIPQQMHEVPVVFGCDGVPLVGVVSVPPQPARLGVLILVGGPQYRVGAHRQFVHLARHLAGGGVAAMRFDFRGMGDSGGSERTFRYVEEDIAAAITAFMQTVPGLQGVVLWGLCGGASAACLYNPGDDRVRGLMLVNPWLSTQTTQAKVMLRHYYLQRLLSGAFWKKLLAGRLNPARALGGLWSTVRATGVAGRTGGGGSSGSSGRADRTDGPPSSGVDLTQDLTQPYSGPDDPLPARMLDAMQRHAGRSVIMLSGRDYVARTFEEAMTSRPAFKQLAHDAVVSVQRFEEDDHTFSEPAARARIEEATLAWVRGLG